MKNKKHSLTKFQIGAIAGGCILVLIIGVVVLFGNRILKTVSPGRYVEKAFLKTVGEIKPGTQKLSPVFAGLLGGKWQQDITLGFNRFETNLWAIDPLYLSLAEMITLKNSTRRDTSAKTLSTQLALQFAVSKMAEITLFGDPDIIALHFPEAFDYAVTADPQKIVPEWDASLLGSYLTPINGIIDGDAFYEYYKMVLTAFSPKTEEKKDFSYVDAVLKLLQSVEYQYAGEDEIGEFFDMFIPEEALQDFTKAVNLTDLLLDDLPNDLIGATLNGIKNSMQDASIQEGVTMRVCIFKGKVRSLDFSFGMAADKDWTLSGTVSMTGEAANLDWVYVSIRLESADEAYDLSFATESKVTQPDWLYNKTTGSLSSSQLPSGAIAFDWEISWDKKAVTDSNFVFSAAVQEGSKEEEPLMKLGLDAEGRLSLAESGAASDINGPYVDCSLKRLDVNFKNSESFLNLSLNANYLLRTASGDITYNKANTVPLTKVGELDVLQMIGRLMENPQWAMILENVLN